MSNNWSITEEQMAKLRKELSGPPPRLSMSTWSIVRSMEDSLKTAREQGKTLEEMHSDIVRCGIDIKLGTFRKYASELLSESPKPKFKAAENHITKLPSGPSLRSMRNPKDAGL
jgi:hypothetical protein